MPLQFQKQFSRLVDQVYVTTVNDERLERYNQQNLG